MQLTRITNSATLRVIAIVGAGILSTTWWGGPEGSALAARADEGRDATSATALVDHVVQAMMRTYHAPGLGLALIEHGKVVLEKGYGYANVQRRIPVSPSRTVWRMASIAVPVTAAAVLQLAEQRRVDLHTDVNLYLRYLRVPSAYGRPITLAELLTQTAGFDDPSWHDEMLASGTPQPFCRYLSQNLPARSMPPGRITSTSDWNTTLAGCVVEGASGMRFEHYVDGHIFRPLGMRHSTFLQPPPPAIERDRATGYDGDLQTTNRPASPDAYNLTVPAAGLRSSVGDITHFMLAQLHGGVLRARRILQPGSVKAMQRLEFTDYRGLGSHAPPVGTGYGYTWIQQHGMTRLEASGSVRGFTSLMTLVPSRKLGLFLVTNMGDGPWIYGLQHDILAHLLRWKATGEPAAPPSLRTSLDQFTGTYWSNEYARHTVQKLGQIDRQVQVSPVGAGKLQLDFWDGSTMQVTRVAPLLFESIIRGDPFYVGFQQDHSGRVVHFINGPQVFDRITWYETSQVQLGLVALFFLLFLSGVIVSVLLAVRRRSAGLVAPDRRLSRVVGSASALLGIFCAFNVAAIVAAYFVLQLDQSLSDQQYDLFTYSVPWYLYLPLAVFLAACVLAALTALLGVVSWRRNPWSRARRLHFWLVTMAGLAFIPFLHYWNLLGFNV